GCCCSRSGTTRRRGRRIPARRPCRTEPMTIHVPALGHNAPIEEWLVAAGHDGLSVEQLLEGFATRLNGEGIAVGRAFLAIATLHPLVRARGSTWLAGQGPVDQAEMPHRDPGDVPEAAWQDSPFRYMLENDVFELRR